MRNFSAAAESDLTMSSTGRPIYIHNYKLDINKHPLIQDNYKKLCHMGLPVEDMVKSLSAADEKFLIN